MILLKMIEDLAEAREKTAAVEGEGYLSISNSLIGRADHYFAQKAADTILPIHDQMRELVEWLEKRIKKCESNKALPHNEFIAGQLAGQHSLCDEVLDKLRGKNDTQRQS